MIKTKFLWQALPANTIAYGVEHSRKDSDFERQIAFLLLDVGSEMALKAFLSITENHDRVIVAKNELDKEQKKSPKVDQEVIDLDRKSFFYLTTIAKKLTPEASFNTEDWYELNDLHKLRDRLYHDGNGHNPDTADLEAYVELSRKLLKALLRMDLKPDAWAISQPKRTDGIFTGLAFLSFKDMKNNLSKALDNLGTKISVIIEESKPKYATRRLYWQIKDIWEDMMKYEDHTDDIESKVEMRRARLQALCELTDFDLDQEQADEILENPEEIWFTFGLEILYKDSESESDQYHDAVAFVKNVTSGWIRIRRKKNGKEVTSSINDPEEIYEEYKKLQKWIEKVDEKARAYIL
jgi:hypothetical protein